MTASEATNAPPHFDPRRKRAILYLVLAVLCWSVAGVGIKLVHLDVWSFSGIVATVGALAQLLLLRRVTRAFTVNTALAILASIGISITSVAAFMLTTASNAIVLQFCSPIFSALFSFLFFRERPKRRDFIAIPFALFGIGLFFAEHLEQRYLIGNIVALISGVFVALCTIFMRNEKIRPPIEMAMLGNLGVAVVCLPATLTATVPTNEFWICIVFGIVVTCLGWSFYAIALRTVTATEALIVATPEAILNPIWVALFIGETPSPLAIAGSAVVLTTVTAYGLAAARDSS